MSHKTEVTAYDPFRRPPRKKIDSDFEVSGVHLSGKSSIPAQAKPASEGTKLFIEAEIAEVLPGFGLANAQTAEGRIFAINRKTPGVNFDKLMEGKHVRCEVSDKFSRVLHAELLD